MPTAEGSHDERRDHVRMSCALKRRVATYTPSTSLDALVFHLVQLNDLSAGGFSFWDIAPPEVAELVLEVRGALEVSFMLSHVRSVARVEAGQFLVRCQFVQRLVR
jgi:hypothetical protein